MRRLIGGIEWLYHGHPYQPETKVDRCQDESRLADEIPDRVSSRGHRAFQGMTARKRQRLHNSLSLCRLWLRTESSGGWVVFEHSAVLRCLNAFRPEFAVADAGANFHLRPDCCDCANDFSALVRRDAVAPVCAAVHAFSRFYIREVHKFFDADAATDIEKCKPEFHLSQKVRSAATR